MRTLTMNNKSDGAVSIRSGEEIDHLALNIHLKKHLSNFGNIVEIRQFPGGFSNLTYLIITETDEYVLRRPPIGANIKSAHDMAREFKVLSMLSPYYKSIPKVYLYCEDIEIIGAPFYVMQKVAGNILRAKDIGNIDISIIQMQRLSELLIDNLAKLHQIDIEATGLINLGKPEGYVDRQVEGWISRYAKSKTDEIEGLITVESWLLANMPRPQKPAFLHNDYKYDNVVFDADLQEIVAVLDWEMATVGDPLMDLGATLAYWCEAGEGEFMKTMNLTWLEGNLTRKQIVNRYTEKTGRDTTDILFYYVFGLYKNATIVQQIYARWKAGVTSDNRFSKLIYGVNELIKTALAAINRNSI
jgi:aminoglycoside phosphotransferase (APT) family kinase protein